MAKLALFEIKQSQLEQLPLVEGQLIVVSDTGNMYKDTANGRITIGNNVILVDELPLVPILDKIYSIKNLLYIYDNEWVCLNPQLPDSLPANGGTAEKILDIISSNEYGLRIVNDESDEGVDGYITLIIEES